MTLSQDALLQRLPELRLQLLSDGGVRVNTGDRSVLCGPHALALLDAFQDATPLQSALDVLEARAAGAHDWVELMDTLEALHRAGVLVDAAAPEPTLAGAGFDAAAIHVAMLNDRARTDAFLAGIAQTVRSGDVVVDLGTGTGVLALAAARAGARRVYAIEAGRIGEAARRLFQANGVADRVTLVPGWSTRVSLPERADVLVSEVIGNDPFAEGACELVADAQRRLLKPRARMVPRRLRVFGLPVSLPARLLRRPSFPVAALRRWRSWYGFDFMPLRDLPQAPAKVLYVDPYRARRWPALGPPVSLADVNLLRLPQRPLRVRRRARATRNGRLDGVLVSFELQLGSQATLATHPGHVRRDNHWSCPLWRVPEQPIVRRGDTLTITYERQPEGAQKASCAVRRVRSA